MKRLSACLPMLRKALWAVAIAFVLAAAWSLRPTTEVQPGVAAAATAAATVPTRRQAETPPIVPGPPGKAYEAAKATPPFETNNLFSAFQAAIGSADRKTLEGGLAAWRRCRGYVALGTGDIEGWVATVMPQDLPRTEWDRRARYARASAMRCAGFALQTGAFAQADEMSRRAEEAGSTSEILMRRLFSFPAASGPEAEAAAAVSLAAASCKVVEQYSSSEPAGIRGITVALRKAAYQRPAHMLNGVPGPSKSLGVNLALCDLDPAGCGIHSNVIGSACIQSGRCDYASEADLWKAETSADVWSEAQGLRKQLVAAVQSGDCPALF